MIKKAIRVEGMTCAMCAKTIENTFDNVEGVTVKVNVAAGKVLATYDENITGLVEIANLINQAGYKAILEESLEDNANIRRALKKMTLLAILLSFPLLWAMLSHLAWFDFLYVPAIFNDGIFQMISAGIVQFFIGYRFYKGAYKSIKKKVLGMDILVVLGTSSAYFYSLYVLVTSYPMMHAVYYFEISAIIITMILIGNYFEHVVKERTTDALVSLMNLGAKEARKLVNDEMIVVPINEVQVGDYLVVLANELFPVDGKIYKGETYVDTSSMTGESVPIFRKNEDEVIGATLNIQERVVIIATKVGSETLLAKIIAHVEEASSEKLPIQRTADKIAGYFVPFVVAISIINFVIHFFILPDYSFNEAFVRSIAILVISCPCALGLATPTSILVGNGMAAQNHILYKGGEFFELANKIQAIAFDKTGTLTIGKPEVTDYLGDEKVLAMISSLESQSNHPISVAVKEYAEAITQEKYEVAGYETLKGKGIKAIILQQEIVIGSKKLMTELEYDTSKFDEAYERLVEAAKTTNFVSIDGKIVALYAVRDDLKPSTVNVIKAMNKIGLETYMITGDHPKVAEAIAKEAGINRVFASVLPHEKSDIIAKIQQEGKITAFVGDGINDAPALKRADVGIAMGYGTDIAIEASDVTLMSHDLGLVIKAIEMSKATLRNIHQNFFWAFSYNLVAIPLAATGRLSMVVAAAAMGFSSIMVVLNALRLKFTKLSDFNMKMKGGLTMTYTIKNMTCNHCKMTLEKTLKGAGVSQFEIDLESQKITVNSDELSDQEIKALIASKGYEVK